MANLFDPKTDWLATAELTAEQRLIWDTIRAELGEARQKIISLETRVREFEEAEAIFAHSVLNRQEFNREVARMLAFDERYGGVSTVIYMTLDSLERVKDTLSKDIAQRARQEICDIVLRHIRRSDVFGQLAPNEFGILLLRCENIDAWKKAEHLAGVIQDTLNAFEGQNLGISVSYGAYTFRDAEDVHAGLKNAAQVLTKTSGT